MSIPELLSHATKEELEDFIAAIAENDDYFAAKVVARFANA